MLDPNASRQRLTYQSNMSDGQGPLTNQYQEGGESERINYNSGQLEANMGPRFTAQSAMSDMLRQHNTRANDTIDHSSRY